MAEAGTLATVVGVSTWAGVGVGMLVWSRSLSHRSLCVKFTRNSKKILNIFRLAKTLHLQVGTKWLDGI